MKRGVDDVAQTLEMARERGKGCALLIGAGCSVTAGIPAASGIVSYIEKRYQRSYNRAAEKTYPLCMGELLPGERRDLIAKYVDPAKLNWAHVCIAQLMKQGYVDRILTTNFDPLVIRACALLGLFPAVYDFAASQTFKAGDIPGEAIVYLHGQRSGFVLLNTRKEVQHHSKLLKPVFAEAGQGRVWLVVGYSGESDPVFDRLAEFPGFDNGLYWVGYPEADPPPHVSKRLVNGTKDAFYVDGFDADSFFIALLQKLECFPPDFIGRPFTYLDDLMDTLAPYKPPGEASGPDFTGPARTKISDAIERYETGKAAETERQAQDLLLAGKLEELERMSPSEAHMTPEIAESLAWGHILEGNKLLNEARTSGGTDADGLFAGAYAKYDAALAIKPDMPEALYNWGNALSAQAQAKTGAEADRLFAAAYEKYEAALAIKRDKREALHNWGIALSAQAKAKTGPEAERGFAAAYEKYEAALAIKPDMHDTLYSWGHTLGDQAETKAGEEADRLFAAAYDKYEATLALKPDMHQALNSWGYDLSQQAKTKTREEADRLFDEAARRYASVEEILPGRASYNIACLNALRGNPEEARRWLERSKDLGFLPARAHLESDSDLDAVRGEDWFADLTASLAGESSSSAASPNGA